MYAVLDHEERKRGGNAPNSPPRLSSDIVDCAVIGHLWVRTPQPPDRLGDESEQESRKADTGVDENDTVAPTKTVKNGR